MGRGQSQALADEATKLPAGPGFADCTSSAATLTNWQSNGQGYLAIIAARDAGIGETSAAKMELLDERGRTGRDQDREGENEAEWEAKEAGP